MKKIIMSVLAIALAVGVVSSAAYALFTDTVNVAGITMTSGNANLVIMDKDTNTFVSESSYSGALSSKLQNLYPGKVDYATMTFTNSSNSNIGLNLTAQLTNSNWTSLGEQVQMTIVDNSFNSLNVPNSGWHTLNEWRANPIAFGATLTHSTSVDYKVFIKFVDGTSAVNNAVAGNSLGGNLTFTGTQATP